MSLEGYMSHEDIYFSFRDVKAVTGVRKIYAYRCKKYVYTIVLSDGKIEISHKLESDAKQSHANFLEKLKLNLKYERRSQ